jgi:hypothetical protein
VTRARAEMKVSVVERSGAVWSIDLDYDDDCDDGFPPAFLTISDDGGGSWKAQIGMTLADIEALHRLTHAVIYDVANPPS